MTSNNKDTSIETRRAVAAALEELRPRAVAVRRAPVPERCPRCGGSVISATDEHGERDDHCLACGNRVGGITHREAVMAEERIAIPGKSRRRQPKSRGVLL